MCDHQEKVNGLHDLRESEPEMCNLLMTWFHMQNPLSPDFLHKICAQQKIQIQRIKYTTHNQVRAQFSCSYQLRTEPKYKKMYLHDSTCKPLLPHHLIVQNLMLSRFLTKCWKTQSTCHKDRIEDGIFFLKLVPIHWSPNFLAQGPRRSQLRRQLFISGFHGLISSDKVGVRIRKLG